MRRIHACETTLHIADNLPKREMMKKAKNERCKVERRLAQLKT
jgi:hypothetical protein